MLSLGHGYFNEGSHSQMSCLKQSLIDMTLAFEDVNSKLVEVVTVADVDAEKYVDDS